MAMTLAVPTMAATTAPALEPEPELETPFAFDMCDDNEGIENELNGINITLNGAQLHVTNAANMTLEIYNLTGVRVMSMRIDSEDKTLNLNLQKGCYMLKVGKVVRKISIR